MKPILVSRDLETEVSYTSEVRAGDRRWKVPLSLGLGDVLTRHLFDSTKPKNVRLDEAVAAIEALAAHEQSEACAQVEVLAYALSSAAQHARRIKIANQVGRFFEWIPARVIPRRVNAEAVGDAIERLTTLRLQNASRWRFARVYFGLLLMIGSEWVRYVVRCAKGKKAG